MEHAIATLQIPGWAPSARTVTWAGHGESFDVWKLADPSGALPPLAVRIARRADMPKPIDQEAAALRQLEGAGIAPRLWTYDGDPGNPLGAPYLVLDFVNGQVRGPEEWPISDVGAVIDQAAHLHALTSRPGTSSGRAWFDGSVDYWTRTAPEIVNSEPVASLVRAVDAFVEVREGAFGRLAEVSLVHGDLVASNILVDDGELHFIDWEWAETDDAARDAALIGGQSYGGPWYVPLSDDQVADLVDRYSSIRGFGESARADFAARRDVWMALDRLFSSISFSRSADPARRAAAATMQSTLTVWLGVAIS